MDDPRAHAEPGDTGFHAVSVADALAAVDGRSAGLSTAEAARRLSRFGPNRLPAPPGRSPLRRLLAQFHNVLIYVLLGSAAMTAALGHAIDTGVILAVVIANAVIGFIQEGRAEQAMGAIRRMLAPRASAIRDGERRGIDSADLVPGDIVMLDAGDRVPADLRLMEARGLRIEEAILTGESVPADKATQAVAADAPVGDRACMAFSGTLVAGGSGRGLVVATGTGTEIGRISGMLSKVETLTTPLLRQMDVFARWLTVVILLIAAALLAHGHIAGTLPFDELFMVVVGLSVAAIPEGLPAVLTITLAVGVQAMARRNAIVRRLPVIETLGAVSVICSDKTGTLTRNEMMVATLAAAGHDYIVDGDGYAPEGNIRRADGSSVIPSPGPGPAPANDPAGQTLMMEVAHASALCNDSSLSRDEAGWRVEGDPMEGALKAFAGKIARHAPEPFGNWRRCDAIPFDAAHRYMAVLHHDPEGQAFIHVKGAPERLLAMCATQRTADGGEAPLESAYWHGRVEDIAALGQRVLALATRAMPGDIDSLEGTRIEDGLVFIGLVGLIDPPRPEAITAVAECHAAGIRVKMITGDHAATAKAIARQVGLRHPDAVLTGADIEALDDAALAAAVVDTDVFARTSPDHKLRLVTALQSHGLTVAMTGDGVNDAPALKRADAGIAMGRKGSEAAKEASVLVLADDDFASIAAAVREGRTVYDNIKKVIAWTLPTNAGEALTIIVALLFAMALPITAVQILWINLITAITLGLALAFEPTEDNTMNRPPRPRHEPLLTGALVWRIVFVSVLFLIAVFSMYAHAIGKGYDPALARTISLNTLVVLEIFNLFFVRNIHGTSLTWKAVRGTPIIWACVIAVTLAQFAVTYLPPLQLVFGTRAVPLADGIAIVAVGALFLVIAEGEKQLTLRLLRRAKPGPP